MAEIVLEFEKPIAELEAKLAEWESLSCLLYTSPSPRD